MIKLLIYEYFYSKKRLLYFLTLLIVLVVIVLISKTSYTNIEEELYQEELNVYIDAVGLKFLSLSFLFIGALFLIDHNIATEIIIVTYKSRTYVLVSKLIFFIFLFFIIVSVIYFFWLTYLLNFTNYYIFKSSLNQAFLSYYLDLLIIMIFSFIFIKSNKQNRIIFLILITIIHNLVLEDNFNKYLFYLYPLNMYNEISNILLYKVLYLSLITILYYIHYEKINMY